MKFDEITQPQNALINDYCVSCSQPLPPGAVFCEHCGPPILPEDIPESGMSIGEAFKKIALLTLVFAGIVAYKTDWDFRTLFDTTPSRILVHRVSAPLEHLLADLFRLVSSATGIQVACTTISPLNHPSG